MKHKEFISIADLMSGLMIVFLFIAVVFMLDIQRSNQALQAQKEAMAEIVTTDERAHQQLHRDLLNAFQTDLKLWDAEILEDNTIRFNAPKVFFESGKTMLRPKFKTILNDFFPRYIAILSHPKHRNEIKAITIEGHTSSDWNHTTPIIGRYLNNLELSQQRALSTLTYCYLLLAHDNEKRIWLQSVLKANGLSFSKRIMINGIEEAEKSRRVEFRVITHAQEKLHQILAKLQEEQQ